MKLTTFILIISLMQVSAATFGQKMSMTENNVTIEKVIREIRKQTGYDVLVFTTKFKTENKLDADFRNTPLSEVMDKIVGGTGLTYTIDNNTIVIKEKEPSFLDKVKDRFFDISVSGMVLDSAGKPLPGASVTVKGTLKAVTTGDGGSFFIQNIKEGSILVISYVGYETQEVEAKANTLMQIRMVASANKLQEVIVNAGYYTVKESQRTGSISRITSKEIEKQPVTNILAAMQGRMAGVNVIQQTGVPGGGFKIEIRGQNGIMDNNLSFAQQIKIGRNEPLYIVDGMPFSSIRMDNPTISTLTMGNEGISPLNGINPADIESFEVLKDADATAIYGSRGANGVILITTKKGKTGKTKFTVNASTGMSKVLRRMELLNTQQYLEMRKEGLTNDVNGADYKTHPYYQYYPDVNGKWDQNRYTDWQKELIGGTANTSHIQAGITGGNANTQFRLSGTYNKTGTVFPGNYNDNIVSAQVNVSHNSDNQRFNVEFQGIYTADRNNLPGPNADMIRKALFLAPNSPALYQPNGELNWENTTFDNPLAQFKGNYLVKNNTLIAGSTLSYKILPGLQIKTILGFTDGRFDEMKTVPSTIYDPSYGVTASSSQLLMTNAKNQGWNIEPQLLWDQEIAKGILTIQVGATFNEQTRSGITNVGSGFSSNALITNIALAINKGIVDNDNTEYRYNALFGRVNYNWDEKYIINVTGRRDGSSRFGPGKQFGNFGAIGAAWLFNKETFIKQLIPALSFGKLRTSYGTIGNDKIGDYEYLNTYGAASGANNYQNVIALQPSRLFNPDFSWETTRKLNLALDLAFFNDRISLTTEYYRNRTSNQLLGLQLPGTTGFSQIRGNLDATVQNTGWEFSLQILNLQGKKLRWSTTFNLSLNRNKLISFPGLTGSIYDQYYAIGKSLNIQKTYNYIGLDKQTGIYTFQDYNGDGKISKPDDNQIIVDLTPKYFGGLANTLSYKNIELDFLFQFVKQQASNYLLLFGMPGTNNINQPIYVLNRWQQEGDNKTTQRYAVSDNIANVANSNMQSSNAAYSDASYIRLKNISLAYTLPGKWLKKSNCKINLQAQNLFTITKYKGLDPETLNSNLPPLRAITAGINLNF